MAELMCRDEILGAPKINGELLKFGFEISERSVSRYLRDVHRREHRGKSWLTLLGNYCEMIVAFDFLAVRTVMASSTTSS